jgi:hypothetical protein
MVIKDLTLGLAVCYGAGPQPLHVGQFVLQQSIPLVLRCHMESSATFGAVPHEIIYDRMKTASLDGARPGRMSGVRSAFQQRTQILLH